MFADQPTVPQTREDRLYIYQRLLALCAGPSRSSGRAQAQTSHRRGHLPPNEVPSRGPAERRAKPPNFSIDYTPIADRLADLDLMLTVSSTAALEAVGAGVRTAFIADLDVREQLGNHIFLESGLLRTFDQLERDDIGIPTKSWVEDYFFSTLATRPAQRLADRALELVIAARPRPPTDMGYRTLRFAARAVHLPQAGCARADRWGTSGPAGPVAAARWVLPYGIQRQLRQARARRQAATPAGRGSSDGKCGARPLRAAAQPGRLGNCRLRLDACCTR